MKKLLTLMLVLVMAAGANAALQLSIGGNPAPDEYTMNVCETIVIDITSTTADNYGSWLVLENVASNKGEWVPPGRIMPAAGKDASMTDYGPMGYPGWWLCEAKSFDPAAPVIAGKHFEMDFHCMAEGDVILTLRAYDETEVDRVVIHQIPEPVSMVLLGLGGLLLRRRK